ncbi:MAG: TolC family protein [Pseudomonadota bacterium]
MFHQKIRAALLITAAVSVTAFSHAESTSLSRAVDQALSFDQRISAAKAQQSAAEHALAEANAAFLPSVNLAFSARRIDEPYTFQQPAINLALEGLAPVPIPIAIPSQDLELFGRDTMVGRLEASYLLYAGGRRRAGREKATMAGVASQQALALAERSIVAATHERYITRWHAEQVLRVAERASAEMDTLAALTSALLQGGSMSLTTKDALRATLAQQKLSGIAAQVSGGLQAATIALNELAAVSAEDTLEDPTTALALSVSAAEQLASSIAQHPNLQQLDAAIAIARSDVRMAIGDRKPVVALLGNYQQFDNDFDGGLNTAANEDGWSVSLNVQVPIFDGGGLRAKVRRHESQQRTLQAQRAYAETGLTTQYRALRSQLAGQLSRLDIARNAVETARNLRDLASRGRPSDHESVQERIEAQLFHALAGVDLLDAQRDALLTQSALRVLTGEYL